MNQDSEIRFGPPLRQLVKCKRPTCEMLTRHNGGYCSPECCKRHKEERKAEKGHDA